MWRFPEFGSWNLYLYIYIHIKRKFQRQVKCFACDAGAAIGWSIGRLLNGSHKKAKVSPESIGLLLKRAYFLLS